MRTDIHRHDFVCANLHFDRDAIRQIDRYGVQPGELSSQCMQAQRGMVWIGFQKINGLEIAFGEVGMPPQETFCPVQIGFREDKLPTHCQRTLPGLRRVAFESGLAFGVTICAASYRVRSC